MQKGLSLQELGQKLASNQKAKKDFITPTSILTMQPAARGDVFVPVLDVPKEGVFGILGTAHDQIAARLDIPRKYYNRMLQDDPVLLSNNVNTWFQRDKEKRLVRTMHGNTRAFLSNRYQRIENEEIAEVALPILMNIPDAKVVSCEVTDKRMYIQVVSPRLQGEVKKGDVVQAGVVVSNSEIGHGSVGVAAMDWRLVCLNGMISAEKFRAYHVGRRIEDNAELWADDTKQADDRAVLLKVRDMVKSAVDAQRFKERLDRAKALAEGKIVGHPEKVVEVLAQKCACSEEEEGGILRALIEGKDLSAWGLVNAITFQAHKAKSYDRAVEFEVMGGQLAAMGKDEWKSVLQAE